MKRKSLIIFSVSFAVILTAVALTPWTQAVTKGSYEKKGLYSRERQSWNDALKWIEARYVDQTTGERITLEKLEKIRKQYRMIPKSKSISWKELGPDNIGGRTRAIQIDRENRNIIWAGGVSGGLFVSKNRGTNWERVDSYINAGGNPYISSMTQTPDGVLFVATGFNGKFTEPGAFSGNGVWYSKDNGETWDKIPGTTTCYEVESSDNSNVVWLATNTGLKWQLGDASLGSVTAGPGACSALKVSKDGNVLIAAFGSNRTYISNDGGSNWIEKTGTTPGSVPPGAVRVEYAISPNKKDGKYSIYVVRTNANLQGMSVSHDDGNTWSQFVGASGTPSNLDIYRDQGEYNSTVTVSPTNNERILIGGIDVWQWRQTGKNPVIGGFEPLTQWFYPLNSPKYAHADQHEMKWDDVNRLYVGNDGGIGISNDEGENWYPANRGYNVTQFYGIAFDKDGAVLGGTQDNGTIYNDYTSNTLQEFKTVGGGDGFECEISFYNPSVLFYSVYFNGIFRSGDKGKTYTDFSPLLPAGYDPIGTRTIHPFHTEFVLAEYFDQNSEDSVTFLPTKNYPANSTIKIPSRATGDSMIYKTPVALYFDDTLKYDPSLTIQNGTKKTYFAKNQFTGEKLSLGSDTVAYNVSWDTLIVQDPFQSWLLVYVDINGGELWGTRNALRLSVTRDKADWVCVAKGIADPADLNNGSHVNSNIDIEFSKDLKYCYVVAGGKVTRIEGLGSVYSSDPQFKNNAGYHGSDNKTLPLALKYKLLLDDAKYEGIAVNPNNSNDIVLFPGFGGILKRSNNATSESPTFTNITIPGGVAVYDGIIDRDDSDVLVIGTSQGVSISENGGASWQDASTGFEGTPVFEVRQSWRTWDEGNRRPGEIYIGTYGRGLWSSTAFLGITDLDGNVKKEFKTKLKTFPNPTNDNTTLTFNLEDNSSVLVQVYSISGLLVKSITKKNMMAGAQTLTIDGSDLEKGTYIVKLIAGRQNDTVKFIKL